MPLQPFQGAKTWPAGLRSRSRGLYGHNGQQQTWDVSRWGCRRLTRTLRAKVGPYPTEWGRSSQTPPRSSALSSRVSMRLFDHVQSDYSVCLPGTKRLNSFFKYHQSRKSVYEGSLTTIARGSFGDVESNQ